MSPTSDAALTPRDRQLLMRAPYAEAQIPQQFQRHIVEYTRQEQPGTIVVDTDARFLYYVMPDRKAIRYGVAVGEEAQAFSGVATVGKLAEWPDWVPTAEIQARLGPYPKRVAGGPANPLGARAIYLYDGNKDSLYRIHGTRRSWIDIGQAIWSGSHGATTDTGDSRRSAWRWASSSVSTVVSAGAGDRAWRRRALLHALSAAAADG